MQLSFYCSHPHSGRFSPGVINVSGKYSVTANLDIPLKAEPLMKPSSGLDSDKITNYYLKKIYALERKDGWT